MRSIPFPEFPDRTGRCSARAQGACPISAKAIKMAAAPRSRLSRVRRLHQTPSVIGTPGCSHGTLTRSFPLVSRLRAACGSLPRAFPRAGVAAVFAAPREARSLDLGSCTYRRCAQSARKRKQWRAVAPGRLAEQPEGGLPPLSIVCRAALPVPTVLTCGFGALVQELKKAIPCPLRVWEDVSVRDNHVVHRSVI